MSDELMNINEIDELYNNIAQLIDGGKTAVAKAVNESMISMYWNIGKTLCDDILLGERAQYGETIVLEISKRLTANFGKGEHEGLVRVIDRVLDEARNKERFHHMVMNQLMGVLVLELMRAFGDETPYYDEKPAQSDNAVRISAAIDYVAENIEKQI